MKLAFQLAYRNLIGAGLRTWLNVIVLSFAFIIIIFFNALLQGWNNQAKEDGIDWDYGYGHILNENYDPYNAFSIQDGHNLIPETIDNAIPILIQQGSIYPEGRMVSVLLKGIETDQNVLKIPTEKFKHSTANIPAIIGKQMADATKLAIGDEVILRWRDKNGAYDASNITIIDIFNTTVTSVDAGQIWLPLEKLWNMTNLHNHATMFVSNNEYQVKPLVNWEFVTQKALLKDIEDIIATESIGSAVMYLVFLLIALLAIFDTQVLSIFKRQKAIGTYVALGMTPSKVVSLFTIEGTMHSIFSIVVGCIYGMPIFLYLNQSGIKMPEFAGDMAIGLDKAIFPVYDPLIIGLTIIFLILASAIVSYLPARKIAKMNPVLALKGKLQ
ncbi:ABC transporter permease [Winogradskyella bathintestinalis]|uniref:FtsX-like permease family protein n=1 Tax=Winogradskyella bathintestinalis TaxID=3035208 RepID=A0ABT7ZX71_9FLAO|nr:FtsX-like permease family protein [Winogradskyella bathintestinalis]MDN3493608.1 FtsX-like permease family protein [Winogradskyella bathintestinalis]